MSELAEKQPLPGDLFVGPFQTFFKKLVGGSFPLFFAAVTAVVWANIDYDSYHHVWHSKLYIGLGTAKFSHSLAHWIDDALMALFFFTVGLEIKREILVGELASVKKALLPVAGAVGGMVLPAAIFFAIAQGTDAVKGWAIPMATDIAFALAVLAMLGKRIPLGLKVFLSALAIADDLGAVMVIALFYTHSILWQYLLVAGIFLVALLVANLLWVRHTLVYALLGLGVWVGILGSGVHATVAGVLVAMFIPAKGRYDTDTFLQRIQHFIGKFECELGSCGHTILLNRNHLEMVQAIEMACEEVETPLQRLEHGLHGWISYLVLPLFALANAGLVFANMDIAAAFGHPLTLGVILGLLLGKSIGIAGFTFLAARIFNASLPEGVTWTHVLGASVLGSIGFTMSLFIAGLSFEDPVMMEYAKLGIMVASVAGGLLGMIILRFGCSKSE